jgi:hypothetical protein
MINSINTKLKSCYYRCRLTENLGLFRTLFSVEMRHTEESKKKMPPFRFGIFLLFFVPLVKINAQSQGKGYSNQIDCTNPVFRSSSVCLSFQPPLNQPSFISLSTSQANTGTRKTDSADMLRNQANHQLYVHSAGSAARQRNPLISPETLLDRDPITGFQRLVQSSNGELLPVFGRDLLQHAPSTFATGDQIPVTADYVLGPGDEILLRLWGPETFNSQLTVDKTGSIYIPKVGAVHVARASFRRPPATDRCRGQSCLSELQDISQLHLHFTLNEQSNSLPKASELAQSKFRLA